MAAPDQTDRRPNDNTTTAPRRRAEDRSTVEEPEDLQPGRRNARRLLRKLRRPMIGLGLVGAAMPMVNASQPPQQQSKEADESAGPAQTATTSPQTDGDTEDKLAEQIAAARDEQERERHVTTAMNDHGISRDLAEDIYDIALEQNIKPRLAYGLVKTESTFDERAISHVGARGLTQVMPRTAKWLQPGTKTEDLYNRQTNLRLGFRYLDQLIDKYKGDVRLALLAYNRGPGTVDKVLKRGGNPNNGYADKVLRG